MGLSGQIISVLGKKLINLEKNIFMSQVLNKADKWFSHNLKYEFQDQSLLILALTHRSASSINNERLEFLGDSILGFMIADHVFQLEPEMNEGDLTRLRAYLVQESTLHKIAVNIDLSDYILLGSGEKKSGVKFRASVLSDTIEALIGAVYLDGGYQQVRKFIKRLFASLFANLPDLNQLKDSKTQLQELLQHDGNLLPAYTLVKIMGADHNQLFYVDCNIEKNNLKTNGKGSSRRSAEQQAAKDMLNKLNEMGT